MKTKVFAAALLLLAGYGVGRASQPAPSHIYELRTYTAADGKLDAVNARFRDHTRTIFERHNMKSVGYWLPSEGPMAGKTLVYILEHPSREDARKNWEAFRIDPEWVKVKAESEAAGPIVAKAESVFMTPADYSAIK
ncbi:MAG TPA: NIPSNAP family protein [Vicinamibacterales bacterium]|nr:NIPSNAP family protein [Vicinamibacterales bacterium]